MSQNAQVGSALLSCVRYFCSSPLLLLETRTQPPPVPDVFCFLTWEGRIAGNFRMGNCAANNI